MTLGRQPALNLEWEELNINEEEVPASVSGFD